VDVLTWHVILSACILAVLCLSLSLKWILSSWLKFLAECLACWTLCASVWLPTGWASGPSLVIAKRLLLLLRPGQLPSIAWCCLLSVLLQGSLQG
jgi:hypothetical protein